MIRKFNYTERQRIPKANAVFRLIFDGERATFDAELNFTGLSLPEAARVYVETYFRGTLMRFSFGTIGAMCPPTDRELHRFPQPELVYFRVKIVDESERRGLLLATCDRLMPYVAKGGPAQHQSIFRVQAETLENEVWRLRFDDDGPVLELNKDIPGIKETARNDPAFSALVYPALTRQVLNHVLLVEKHHDPNTDDDWRAMWLKFGTGLTKTLPPRPPQDEGDIQEWIDKVITKFSARNNFITSYLKTTRKESAA